MSVTVNLKWTNPSLAPTSQTIEVDLGDGNGFGIVTYVNVGAEHVAGVTEYTYDYAASLTVASPLKFRIITTGVTGATVTGNEFTIDVPGSSDLIGVSDLGGSVTVA